MATDQPRDGNHKFEYTLSAAERALYVAALEILEKEHVAISQGKVMKDDAGNPILDDGPRLAAIREMRMLRESFRKLYGLDAEKKVNISGGVRYEIVGIDSSDLS
jgi:hypothetical protein